MSFESINFDMSRQGLLDLSDILEPHFDRTTEELQNFANVIRNLLQRAPALKESSWMDE